MNFVRRCLLLSGLGSCAVLTTGCMTKPLRSANANGNYCHRSGKSSRQIRTCTPTAIPALAVEEQAKRFEPDPGALTVYLVRKRWGDGLFLMRVATEGATPIDLVPETFARWRLRPGRHRLTLTWPDDKTELDVSGSAGDVLFVEVVGMAWAWGSTFRLEVGNPRDSRKRAADLRLVADVA
jgi:hypothetical protein